MCILPSKKTTISSSFSLVRLYYIYFTFSHLFLLISLKVLSGSSSSFSQSRSQLFSWYNLFVQIQIFCLLLSFIIKLNWDNFFFSFCNIFKTKLFFFFFACMVFLFLILGSAKHIFGGAKLVGQGMNDSFRNRSMNDINFIQN